MNQISRAFIVPLQLISDALAVSLGLLAAYYIRFHSGILYGVPADETDYARQFVIASLTWILALQICGATGTHPRIISFNRSRRILRASVLALLFVTVFNYFTREFDVARLLYPVSFITVTGLIIGFRMWLQQIITTYLLRDAMKARVLIVGTSPTALRIAARCRMEPELAYKLVGFITRSERRVGRLLGGVPILGTTEDLRRILRDHEVDEIFVAQSDARESEIFELVMDSEREYARINVVPTLSDMMRSQIHYDEVAGLPIYTVRETPLQGLNAIGKRCFDIVVSAVALTVLLLPMIMIYIAVRRSSPGPGLYKQSRLGLDGRQFHIYKFRTLPVGSDRVPNAGPTDDPRANRIGRFLRLNNLDELPQLWNVLRGDMSLVGPRPEQPFFVERFRELIPRYMTRHSVKTGMTGWAQVHGLRGDTSIQQRLRYDLYYIENWTFWLDLKILIMTIFLPVKRHGIEADEETLSQVTDGSTSSEVVRQPKLREGKETASKVG